MSGTEIPYGAIVLRARNAMSSADIPYGHSVGDRGFDRATAPPTRQEPAHGTVLCYVPTQCVVLSQYQEVLPGAVGKLVNLQGSGPLCCYAPATRSLRMLLLPELHVSENFLVGSVNCLRACCAMFGPVTAHGSMCLRLPCDVQY
eukprot:2337151-Rhodomonas_salina.2